MKINRTYSSFIPLFIFSILVFYSSDALNSMNYVASTKLVANLSLTKAVSNSTPITGETFIYTLQYSCSGTTDDCSSTFITDPLPSEVEFVSVAGSAHTITESYDAATHTVTFNFIGTMLAGTTGEVQIVVRFPNGNTANGTVATNTATIDATNASAQNSNSVDATAVASDNSHVEKRFEAGTVLDENTAYFVEFCNPQNDADPSGSLNATNITIIDTLPTGTDYVYSNNSGVYDLTSHTVTWTTDTIKPGNCSYYTVVIIYPSTTFSLGQAVTNKAAYSYTPFGESVVNGNSQVTTNVNTQSIAIGTEKSVSQGSFYPGASGSFNMSWWNNSNISLDNYYLEDSIPAGLEITDIGLGAHYYNIPANIDLTIRYQTNLNTNWTTTPGSPHIHWVGEDGSQEDVSTFGLAAGEYITLIRWEFGPDAMPISSGGYFDVILDFDVMLTATDGTYTNCYTAGYQGGTINTIGANNCVNYNILPTISDANLNPVKSRPGGILNPGDTETFQLAVRNEWGAGDSLENPIVYDLLPEGVTYQPGTWTLPPWGNTPSYPDPVFTYIANYNGTGRELLKWEWTGANGIKISPGERVVVAFDVTIPEVVWSGTPSFYNHFWIDADNIGVCLGTDDPDIYDIDGDGDFSETFCGDQIGVDIVEIVAIESEKLVKGQLDSTWTKYPNTGNTLPGGIADYQLIVRNKGTVDMTDIVVIDILPALGDSSVVTLDNRDSRWRPNLVGDVTAPADVTVYYSTENNPCRSAEGIVPTGPVGCDAPSWTTTIPVDIASVQSLKFDFGTTILEPGDSILLEWPMRAPVGVLNTIGAVPDSIAWNSFGYIASRADNGTTLPPGEPIKVGMIVSEQIPGVYGDFVWNDSNANGIQDEGELGIDNIRVDLFKDNGDGVQNISQDTFVNFTVTANGGYYLFPNLPEGDYFLMFYKPATYLISPSNVGGDDAIDSDGIGMNHNGFLGAVTPIINLLDTEYDYDWDLGIYQNDLGAIGNYVWEDLNTDNIQNESVENGINGVTVNLFENSNPGTILATDVTTDDFNGNPGYYLFDLLPPGDYFLEFVLPSSTTFVTQGATGSNDPSDSDPNPTTGRTEVITLVENVYDDSWDAGLILSGTEDCTNGIDDDGDGLVDYLDNECDCPDSFPNPIDFDFSGFSILSGTGLNLGDKVLYSNVGDIGGQFVDVVATVVNFTNLSNLDEHEGSAGSGNALIILPSSRIDIGVEYSAEIQYELFEAGTSTPINASFEIEIADIDFVPSAGRTEHVEVLLSEVENYYLSASTNLDISFPLGNLRVTGKMDQFSSDPQGAVKFVFVNQNRFSIIYGMTQELNSSTGRAGFAADGNSFAIFGECFPDEICGNGIDDDGDLLEDCDDPDCGPTANNETLVTCDNSNGTGSGSFNLSDASSTVIGGNTSATVSYHSSLFFAENDLNELPFSYITISTTIYARLEGGSFGCYDVSTITLTVSGACVEDCTDGIDNDGDGLIDCFDCDECGNFATCADNDGDGIGDFCDLDDDNDGIPDSLECSVYSFGPELVVNGDFEDGYAYWTSNFNRGINNNIPTQDGCMVQGWVVISPCASLNGLCEDYFQYNGGTPDGSVLITDPYGSGDNVIQTTNCNSSSDSCYPEVLPDNTTGSGLSLYVDPSDIAGKSYWQQEVTIEANRYYEFSAWIMVIEEDPILQFKINDTNITAGLNLDRQTGAGAGPDIWQEVATLWYSNSLSGNVIIELVNLTAGCMGNDIRLDDVSLKEVIRDCDCDGDGVDNYLDLDSDNDGLLDVDEAGHIALDGDNDGIIDLSALNSGTNGLYDGLETSADNGVLIYSVADSETIPDGNYDFCELDSDGDGCLDVEEEDVTDPDDDGIVGISVPTINPANGLVTTYTYVDPPNNIWQNPLVGPCLTEDCSDGIDNDLDGFIDDLDTECCGAKAPTLSKF